MLHVTDLTCARGGRSVLAGVTLAVASGEALLLRGPNGSGKTTLLRTIAGLQPAVSGVVTAEEDSIAYAAHLDGIKSTLTVIENLNFWAKIFGTDDVEAALQAFKLHGLQDRVAQNLSAGQKRRLGLARLVLTGRPIWALDEPTVSLDAHSVGLFAKAIETHLNSGGAAIIATHIDLGFAARVLDVSIFQANVARQQGTFDEAFL